ncbi:unnamed protein product [Darwinula stevensoni]|uniref:Peptidase S1 domain-containing protein n=1 Tax=Darwinula stevensoni TaxID=69355 RepID=A0A7R9AEY0_9CRUS|nr:unnamed protein product [Darwinula stevensoni]CAG0902079.1 unnamed protein product [Darwinula stevensoni]
MKGIACCLSAFLLLLLPEESAQGKAASPTPAPPPNCPSSAPPSLSLTSTQCGQSSVLRTRQTWLQWMWNSFTETFMGSQDLEREEGGGLIFNGAPATIAEAPFMAYIESFFADGSGAACSASILSEKWILTAAHCVVDSNNAFAVAAKVYVGNADNRYGALHDADSVARDGAFNINNIGNGHDIAFYRLATPLTFSPSIQPICFPTTDTVLGTAISDCDQRIYGWGKIDAAGQTSTNTLQKLNVTVSADVSACSSLTDETVVCVRGDVANSGACFGDSGGPLVVRYNGRAFVTGIASYVVGGCAPGIDGYTRASKYSALVQQAAVSGAIDSSSDSIITQALTPGLSQARLLEGYH